MLLSFGTPQTLTPIMTHVKGTTKNGKYYCIVLRITTKQTKLYIYIEQDLRGQKNGLFYLASSLTDWWTFELRHLLGMFGSGLFLYVHIKCTWYLPSFT